MAPCIGAGGSRLLRGTVRSAPAPLGAQFIAGPGQPHRRIANTEILPPVRPARPPPIRTPSFIMRFSNLKAILFYRSNDGGEAYRYSYGRRRRSRTEFRNQDGGVPRK